MNAVLKKVVVVDDEKGICDSIERILVDVGFSVACYQTGKTALDFIHASDEPIHFVLMDIWMPEMDGNDLLKKIKHFYANKNRAANLSQTANKNLSLPPPQLIVMSGHIDSSASSQLIKNGASAFLEKPFTRDQLLQLFLPKLQQSSVDETGEKSMLEKALLHFTQWEEKGNVYSHCETLNIRQKTLANSVVKKGVGIHSGSHTGIILSPLPEGSGIIFEEMNTGKTIPALMHLVSHTAYSTGIHCNGFSLTVIEHLLSALHGYGITNVKIKVNREIPILDGSARPFCALIEKAGVLEQEKPAKVLVIDAPVAYADPEDRERAITIEPYDGLFVDYRLFVSSEFGEQHFKVDLSKNKQATFFNEISHCRTFGFLGETQKLQGIGMALGANLGNSLLLHENKVINSELVFENEFARHKVLDILGDFYLLNGLTLRGKITARGTGHRHNSMLLKKVLGLHERVKA